ncbi:MAG: DinB family protein [Acidobacteria bacterium]|nr:DinB family protein [Acidobacteriota bacterium]
MDREARKKAIAQYKDGYRVVADALQGATDAELDARPAPGKWSAREIVHHLADSEMTSAVRLRLLVASDRPAIAGYDQDEFARRLYYDRPIEASLEAFKAARRTTADILERMTDAEWAREGTHTEHGRYTVEQWLEIYSTHAHKHADQILVARDAARQQRLRQ